MAASQPIAPPPTPPPTSYAQPAADESYRTTIHNLSLACLLICPILIALPPRKLDLYTATLGGATILSANRLHTERYGHSIGRRFISPSNSHHETAPSASYSDSDGGTVYGVDGDAAGLSGDLPTERARAVAAELRRRRLVQERGKEAGGIPRGRGQRELEGEGVKEEGGGEKGEGREGKGGVLAKAWYGSEGEDWEARREREIQAKFAEGKGIGDIIMDQIWEVISWGQAADGSGGDGGGVASNGGAASGSKRP